MKKKAISQAVALIIGSLVLATIIGCGGGGGGGGTPSATAPSITTTSLPPGVRSQLYSVALEAAGGTTPYGWSATDLPPGISLDPATGVLSGTPTTDNSYAPTFTVTDHTGLTDSKTITFVIQPLPSPSVSTASLPAGVLNQPYLASLSATSGTSPYTWSITEGSPPTGVVLSAGALTGTPTVAGTFSLTLTVTDANGLTGSKPLFILINSPVVSPVVAMAALPSGIQNQPYTALLAATSGTKPYTWSVPPGSLPTGVVLSAGALTGTPTVAGTFPLTLTVTDANGLTGSKPLSILINSSASPSPTITTSSLPDGARTEPYSKTLLASGGTGSYTWSVSTGPGLERLPSGVSLNGATGSLSGIPSEEGTFSPVFTVTDSASLKAVKSLGLWIAKPLVLFVADYSTPSGAVNMFDDASVAYGASAWTRQLKGDRTTLDNNVGGPPAGVSYDAARKILYVARTRGADNGAVLAFNNADVVYGNVMPDRTLRTFTIPVSNTISLTSPSDVFIDSGKDRIYIADVTGSSGFILLMDSASATPVLQKIFLFTYGPPAAISVDVGRDILYVVSNHGTGIIAYDNVSGSSGGLRSITINSTGVVGLADVKIDPATDTVYAADYDGGRVFVINNVSQKSGTYLPDRTLTGLSNPNSLFLDVANDRLFVSNRDGATSYSVRVVENMSSASVNGPVSFSRQLSGFGVAAGMTGYYK